MNNEDSYRKEDISFRVLDVPEIVVNKFKADLPDLSIAHSKWGYAATLDTKRRVCPEGPISIMVVDISDRTDCMKLQKYLEQQPLRLTFGVWVGLVTDYDSDGLSVPAHVVDLIRSVGGTLDFSFVCVADWDVISDRHKTCDD